MSLEAFSPFPVAPTTPDKKVRDMTFLNKSPSQVNDKNTAVYSRTPSYSSIPSLEPINTPMTERASTPINDSVNGDSEWSSAVGKASLAGKSGRVIERLMGEIDKLKRELNLAQARVEEEQSRSLSARETLDSLRGTKENLEAICETNKNVIYRRDRKIEELKTDLDFERVERSKAERGRNDLSIEMENLKRDCEKEVLRASEVAARTTAEYDTFRKSLQRMKTEWDKQMCQMRKELDVVQQDRDTERIRLRNLGSICDQLRAEQYKMAASYDRMSKDYMSYKEQMNGAVRGMADRISTGDLANQELHEELQKTLDQMRWLMNVRRNVPSLLQNEPAPGG